MLKPLIALVFICVIKFVVASEIDSLKQKLDTLPLIQQIEIISNMDFNTLVANNHELIPMLHKYINIAIKKNDSKHQAKLYTQISLAYYYNGQYHKNFEYGLKAIHLYDSLNNKNELGTLYGELGYQMKRRNLSKAFKMMQTGIHILEDHGNPEPLAKIYDNYGVLHEMDENIDSAVYYYNKALSIKRSMNDSLGIPYSLNNIFMSYLLKENFDSALCYLNESTHIRQLKNDAIGLAENYCYYGNTYFQLNQFEKAEAYYQKSLEKAKQHNYTYLVKDMYQNISLCYEKLNKPNEALHFYKFFKQYQDSLLNEKTNKTIADLEVKFETAEKEKKILIQRKELNNQRILKWLFSGVALLFALAIAMFYRYKLNINKRNEKIKTQQALMEGEQNERTRLAMELHDGLGSEINGLIIAFNNYLDNTTKTKKLITNINKLQETHEMVRQISHNLMPRSLQQKGLIVALHDLVNSYKHTKTNIILQFQKNLTRLSPLIEFNMFRVIQEALNNALKYAEAENILINGIFVNSNLLVTIEDNGKGFIVDDAFKSKGLGLLNLSNRVKLLNGKLTIESSVNEGTTIEIQIPLTNTAML